MPNAGKPHPNQNSKYEDDIFPKDVFRDSDRFAPRYMPEKKKIDKYQPDFSQIKSHRPKQVPFEWESSYINHFSHTGKTPLDIHVP